MNGQADASYKFGAGRVVMQRGLLGHLADELGFFGKKPFFVGGPTSIELVRERAASGLTEAGIENVFSAHSGQVCHQAAQEKAAQACASGCDVVVAVGGGRAMDFGKLVAYYARMRVVCLPTSASTCAAYTPFSMIYTPEGRAVPGNFCYELENSAVWIDLDVMAEQPARYLVSGMLDAMAKAVEITNGKRTLCDGDCSLPLYAGYLLAQYTFERLESSIDTVLDDLENRRVSQELESMIFLNIPLTGIISSLSRGTGQSALAHELYYQLRTLFPQQTMGSLHGEIVGLGMIPQMFYNGATERVEPFRAFLRRLGAPTSLGDVGLPLRGNSFGQLLERLLASPYVGTDASSRARLIKAMELIAC